MSDKALASAAQRRPAILRRLKRYLENKKGGMLELLKVVESGQESGEV